MEFRIPPGCAILLGLPTRRATEQTGSSLPKPTERLRRTWRCYPHVGQRPIIKLLKLLVLRCSCFWFTCACRPYLITLFGKSFSMPSPQRSWHGTQVLRPVFEIWELCSTLRTWRLFNTTWKSLQIYSERSNRYATSAERNDCHLPAMMQPTGGYCLAMPSVAAPADAATINASKFSLVLKLRTWMDIHFDNAK